MLLLRTLFAMFVLTMTSTAAHVVDIKFDPSLEMPPLPEEPDKFETYTIHSCLESLENDPNVAFSADQVLSNEEDFPRGRARAGVRCLESGHRASWRS